MGSYDNLSSAAPNNAIYCRKVSPNSGPLSVLRMMGLQSNVDLTEVNGAKISIKMGRCCAGLQFMLYYQIASSKQKPQNPTDINL